MSNTANTPNTNDNLSQIKAIPTFKEQIAKAQIAVKSISQRIDAINGNINRIKAESEAKIVAEREAEEAKIRAAAEAEQKKAEEAALAIAKAAEAEKPVQEPIVEATVVEKTEPVAETAAESKPEKVVAEAEVKTDVKSEVKPSAPATTAPPRQNIQTRVFNNSNNTNNRDNRRPPYQQNGANSGNRDNNNRPPRQGDRPQGQNNGGFKPRPQVAAVAPPPVLNTQNKGNKTFEKKKPTADDKKTQNKRSLIRRGFITEGGIFLDDEDDGRWIKGKKNKKNEFVMPTNTKITSAVVTTEIVPIKVLSEKIGKTGTEIIKQLFILNIAKTINESIDFETAELVASELGVELVYRPEKTAEDTLSDNFLDEDDNSDNLSARPPIVTIMGHVDHGKTSLLDYIRKANVAGGEAGGITQHIGAYTITLNGNPITFLDTPGHEAFTAMRMRGAQVTDIAIIVVAADDGIMPQTIEAINHAKAAGVSIIVAVNKIDKQGANPDRVLQQLTEHEILPEDWGGDTPVVYVSAKTGENVQKLLETILLVAEIKELKANPSRLAKGTIIEARLDKGRGPVATVLVQSGTLRVSDNIVAGECCGKIRAMLDDKGRSIKEAGPSIPVSVLGFQDVPNAGDLLFAVAEEKLAKQVAEERKLKNKTEVIGMAKPTSLDDLFDQLQAGVAKDLNIIVKADVQGSVEAVKQSLVKLSNDEVKIHVVHGGVGAITETDVMLAKTASAIIIGFNVRPDTKARTVADRDNIDIRCYRIIYDAIDDITKAIKGMLQPKFKENVLGRAEIRQVYKITGAGNVAGCMVTDGKVIRSAKVRLLRDNVVVFEGELSSLKRFKDDVKEVAKGYDCGMSILNYGDIKEGDVIEAYVMEQIDE